MENPEQRSTELAREGAIITVWNSPPESFLVGRLQWLSDTRLFFFAANGDGPADAHELEFDTSHVQDGAVQYFRGGKLVGLVTSLEQARVADPEDYKVGWQIWQITAPMKQPLIDQLVDAKTQGLA